MLSLVDTVKANDADSVSSFLSPGQAVDPTTPLNFNKPGPTPTTDQEEGVVRSRTSSIGSSSSKPSTGVAGRRRSRYSKEAVPLEHPDTEQFNSLDKLLKTHGTLDETMNKHLRELSGHKEAADVKTQSLGSLESDLNSLTNTFVEMKSLREDFSEAGGMEIRTLSTPLINDLFPMPNSRPNTKDASEMRLRRSRAGSYGDLSTTADSTRNGAVETQAKNRYPLRRRASAVRFASKIARQRKSRLEPMEIPTLKSFQGGDDDFGLNNGNNQIDDQYQDSGKDVTGEGETVTGRLKRNLKALELPPTLESTSSKSPKRHQERSQSVLLHSPIFKNNGKYRRITDFEAQSDVVTDGMAIPPTIFSLDAEEEESSDEEEDAEEAKFQDMIRPLTASRKNFLTASRNYDKFAQKQGKTRPRTPRRLYMESCKDRHVNPEPAITRSTKGVNADGGVSFKNYGMGDDQVEALSSGFGAMFLKYLDLSNNRIMKERAATRIINKLDPHLLQKLDMSKNRLGPKSFEVLINLVSESTALLSLGLEETTIKTDSIKKLCNAICRREVCPATDVVIYECPLKVLNLAGNHIGDDGVKCLANAIPNSKNLISLDLSWNNIRKQGAVALFNSVNGKTTLENLDVGYNALGTFQDDEREAVHALAKMLGEEDGGCSLTHLNLSHNQLGVEDCKIISSALKSNHNLMGLHVEGNMGWIDSKGFLIPEAEGAELRQHATVYSRILPDLMNSQLSKKHKEWKVSCNCWVCEVWQEYTFEWDPDTSVKGGDKSEVPTDSYKVELVASYEKWERQKLKYDGDSFTYKLVAMVPPGKQQYGFIINSGEVTIAIDQESGKRDVTWGNYSDKSVKKLPYRVNNVVMKRPSDFDVDKALEPRNKEIKKKKVGPWKFSKSLFAKDYQQDSEEFLDECFEFDYGCTGLYKKIAKKGTKDDLVVDEAETKQILRRSFEHVKHLFKSYAAAIGSGNEIFTMGKNAYYEFLGACDIMDGEEVKGGCGRAEVALVFVACQTIGPKSSFNKKNALCRFQFMEALVSLAGLKYINTKMVKTYAEAVDRLLQERVLPQSDLPPQKDYRHGIIYVEQVDLVLRRNLPLIEVLFKAYSGKTNLPNERVKTCSSGEWAEMCLDAELVDDGFIDRHIRVIYTRSIATCKDELHDNTFRSMNFTGFIHGICWLASFMDVTNGSLPSVLQKLLTRLIDMCITKKKGKRSTTKD